MQASSSRALVACLLLCLLTGAALAQSPRSNKEATSYTDTSSDTATNTPSRQQSSSTALPDAQGTPRGKLPCPKLTVDRLELERGFTYQEGGLDWDNSTWSCLTGILQSPINFPSPQGNTSYGKVAPGKAASFDLGTANATAIRTTAAYRIQVEAAWSNTNITIPVCGGNLGCFNKNQSVPAILYNATLQKIQFKIPSDHAVYGVQYPMEAQVIMSISQDDLSTCPSAGCQVGLSVLYTLFDDPEKINLFLDSIIPYIPYSGTGCQGMPANVSLDLSDFLPSNRSYFTYRGSFTSPPCTEGLSWYVMSTPVQAGPQQVVAFQNAMAQVQRPCGDGRVAPTKQKKESQSKQKSSSSSSASSSSTSSSDSTTDSGKRHLLQRNTDTGNGVCVIAGTRSNNRPTQPLGTRIINYFQDNVGTNAASA